MICFLFVVLPKHSHGQGRESARVLVDGVLTISSDNAAGLSVPLSYISSAVVSLEGDTRFVRGVELSLTVPQAYLARRGSLGIAVYTDMNAVPGVGVADIEARSLFLDPLLNKIQTVYQIPIRASHGLRTTPYATVSNRVVSIASFPILVRIMPVIKGIEGDIEQMSFTLSAKPVLSNEGALSLSFRHPEHLKDKPFIVLIDDVLVENRDEERLLREGEHHLVIVSEDFRNESRTFLIERGKTLEMNVDLHDPSPVVFFEAPDQAAVYFDGTPVSAGMSVTTEPGRHEVRMELSDYTIIRSVTMQKGKTYKISLLVDLNISEE